MRPNKRDLTLNMVSIRKEYLWITIQLVCIMLANILDVSNRSVFSLDSNSNNSLINNGVW